MSVRRRRAVVPADLPPVDTMSVDDLRAEVDGGRIAYADLVEDLRLAKHRNAELRAIVRAGTSPTTIALWKQDAEHETRRRIVAWLRAEADARAGRGCMAGADNLAGLADAIERGDWKTGG